jgi:hypothetical protein
MKRGAKLSVSISIVVALSISAQAQDVAPKDFDFACAVVSSAEIATTQPKTEQRNMAFTVFSFYMGRLTARDDRTYWGAVIKGRIAELREKSKSLELYDKCMKFYASKLD